MSRKRNLAWITLFMAIACTANAESPNYFYDGNTVKKWLDAASRVERDKVSPEDYAFTFMLHGYIAAVTDMAMADPKMCIPNGIALKQAIAITNREIEASPEDWTQPGWTFIRRGLSKAFPCQKK